MSKTVHHLKMEHDLKLPQEFQIDVRYPSELVQFYLERFTKEGDLVLDPFMGFGTTLMTAEKLKRHAIGIEYDADRCTYVKKLLQEPDAVRQGDSRRIKEMNLPDVDFCMTSPPYMGKAHKENPFTAYSTNDGAYDQYLNDLKNIFSQINQLMNRGGHIVVEVSNLKHEDGSLTTLAWDMGRELSKVLSFKGEEIICWEPTYGFGYDHSYCLLFESDDTVAR